MRLKVTEQSIIKAILEYLSYNNIFAWRNNAGAFPIESNGKWRYFRAGFAGISDIIGILPDGRMLCIEVKTKKGVVSFKQQLFLDTIKRSGGLAFVARSVEDVRQKLKEYITGRL